MTKEEIRANCYVLALETMPRLSGEHKPEKLAEKFVKFVGDAEWRFIALGFASNKWRHNANIDKVLELSQAIADFVDPPKIVTPAPPRPAPKRDKKKRGR